MSSRTEVAGKSVLVTGANRGIGRALVEEALRSGAKRVYAATRRPFVHPDDRVTPVTMDVTDATQIKAAVEGVGSLDILVNNAGIALYDDRSDGSVLEQPPPEGVAVPASEGTRFLLYSFSPNELVINGFLQTLIGLWDYWHASGDTTARALFKAASPEAQYELPSYDTGAWSLYEPGQEDTLSYHQLVTGFLRQLCDRTGNATYCGEASRFNSYLKTPPVLALTTTSARSGASFPISFTLSKISNVTLTITNGSGTVFTTTSQVPYGTDSFTVPALGAGSYTVTLSATDLAGNVGTTAATLTVQ